MNERWLEDRDDEISKLFRDNEEQLEETPSFRTWDRLERKLDRRRGQKRKVMYRYTSMIAASIAVFAMVYIIGFLDSVSFDGEMAQNTKEAPIENTNSDDNNTSDKKVAILEEQAEYKTLDKNNFKELDDNKLTKIEDEPIASNFINQPKKSEEFTAVSPKIAKTNDLDKENTNARRTVEIDAKPSKRVKVPSSDWTRPEEEETEEVVADEDIDVYDDAATYKDEKSETSSLEEAKLNSQGNPVRTQTTDKKLLRKDKNISSKAERSYTEKEKTDIPQITYSVNQFNWMHGNWRDVSIGGSYENWQISKNGLIGNGYVVISGDTSFVEQMRIYQRGKDIYFEGPVDATQKTRKFKLESYAGNEAIFNRKGKNFPNQVVITRHTNNSYSIVYQNKDAIKVDTTEQLYFKYRNRINSQRAARNMTRY